MIYFKIVCEKHNCSVAVNNESYALMLGTEIANLSNDIVYLFKQIENNSICWTTVFPENKLSI